MNKLLVTLLAVLISVCGIALPYATSQDVPVSAQILAQTPSVTLDIRQLTTAGQDPFTGTQVQSMNFGTLTHTIGTGPTATEAGLWYSPTYFCVVIFTNSFGIRYEIRSSCTGLTSGANFLPLGSFGVTPGYSAADRFVGTDASTAQGTQPSGSTLFAAGPAITGGTFKAIYDAEPAASNRIIRAFYALPPFGAPVPPSTTGTPPFTGFTPIPLSQAPGTYTGTVTITIANLG